MSVSINVGRKVGIAILGVKAASRTKKRTFYRAQTGLFLAGLAWLLAKLSSFRNQWPTRYARGPRTKARLRNDLKKIFRDALCTWLEASDPHAGRVFGPRISLSKAEVLWSPENPSRLLR